ncbi:MAG: substrate-binding domain-containing protein [Planctomycetaceae bacterium]
MTNRPEIGNSVRRRRTAHGWTQAQLARRAGISRTAVTAIEARRLTPSVAVGLALAEALGCNVEELFGRGGAARGAEIWAWQPSGSLRNFWRAEVAGKTVLYPAGSLPMLTPLPDMATRSRSALEPNETLVIACCDPAAGLLASQYAALSGLRLLVISRSSREAVEMLRNGLVHMAGLHLATGDKPDGNTRVVREALSERCELVRVANWQEGIAVSPAERLRSVNAARKAKLNWIGREPGSGARQCLDRVLGDRPGPRRIARHHRGVAEAVQAGWADAGVCVELVSVEAGLDFLPVQEEAYDVCYPASLADDRRVKAFLSVVRSPAYRKVLGDLPGYNTAETGSLWGVN